MITCNCFNTDYQQIRWYSPDEEEILAEPEDLPYVIQEKGTLVIPVFNNSYQGTYYCGIGNDSLFTSTISLTLWIGMCVFVYSAPYGENQSVAAMYSSYTTDTIIIS